MELQDFKNAWNEYDKKLSENLKLNESLLKEINLQKTKNELQKPLIYEIINVGFMLILTVYLAFASIQYQYELKYLIPGIVSTIISGLYLSFSIRKVRKFLNLNYFDTPILDLQKSVTSLNLLILKLRKFELILFPAFAVALLPILFISVRHFDIYENTRLLIIEICLIFATCIPLSFWINKYLFDKKLKNAEQFLMKINSFERD
ncbi:MAG: hypothetical protein IPG89_20425 [Bacteroidetes bacterium]|nr:hypothetical protein [Bacteroidota bacterium]